MALLWVSQKSLIWYCYRITSNCNHTRENGNKFSSLLGCLSLVNLYFCQKDPTLTQHHSGDSPWEHVAGQQNLDGSDGSVRINTKRLLSRTEPQSFTRLAFFSGNERKMFLSSSSFLKKKFHLAKGSSACSYLSFLEKNTKLPSRFLKNVLMFGNYKAKLAKNLKDKVHTF